MIKNSGKFYIKKLDGQRGASAILLSFFVLSVILLIALTAAAIMIYELKMSREIAYSIPAFFAADAGAEQCLYQVRNLSSDGCGVAGNPAIQVDLSNGATVEFERQIPNQAISRGTYLGVNRKIEIDW